MGRVQANNMFVVQMQPKFTGPSAHNYVQTGTNESNQKKKGGNRKKKYVGCNASHHIQARIHGKSDFVTVRGQRGEERRDLCVPYLGATNPTAELATAAK
jgi:hypothetical protein